MDLSEVKNLIEAQGRTWEEFKATNDARLDKMAKGESVTELETKLTKINAELARIGGDYKTGMAELETKLNRASLGTGGDKGSQEQSEHKTALFGYVRKGQEAGLREAERKAMTVGSDPDGGYLVTEEMETTIDRTLGKNVAMMGLATVRTIGAASYKKRVRVSGAGHKWVGEAEETGETETPKYAVLEFAPGTISAEPQISQDLLEDSDSDVEGEIMDALDQDFSEGVGEALIIGSGVKKPRGLLAYDTVDNANYAWGKLGFIKSGAAADFAAANPSDKLIDLIHGLKSGYRGGAAFLLNDLTLAKIRKFKDGQGNYLWVPGLENGATGKLLGYQTETDDNMPDVAANAMAVAFGNFKRGYVVVRRRGVAVLRDPYTAKPFVKFYATLRIGGGVQNFEAIKLLKIAA